MSMKTDKQQPVSQRTISSKTIHLHQPISSDSKFSSPSMDDSFPKFEDNRPQAFAQRKLKTMMDYAVRKAPINKLSTIQRMVVNEKSGYILDKFNRPQERAQEIAIALYEYLYRNRQPLQSFDYYYDIILALLEPDLNKLIDDDVNTTSISILVDQLKWINPQIHDGTNDVSKAGDPQFKSQEKDFFETTGNKIIAYSQDKSELVREMYLYKQIERIKEVFTINELILPHPEWIYNDQKKQYGIKMDYIQGINIDVYNRNPDEIRGLISEAADDLGIDVTKKEEWVENAFKQISVVMKRLEKVQISIYDLQGILDRNGVWTIIDPMGIAVDENTPFLKHLRQVPK